MTKNAYIHIPFCKSKCNYCSFISSNKLTLKDAYIEALILQIKSSYKGEALNTLYFGGGTPSTLTINDFEKIISLFNIDKNTEITAEINPEGIEKAYLKGLKDLGINRISIGSQTFDDEILTLIGRRHNSMQVENAVKLAKEAGFKNISLDLIYGLPTQTINGFESDLNKVINLDVQHISLYGLKIEEGCYFFNTEPASLPDSDTQAEMYLFAVKKLTKIEILGNTPHPPSGHLLPQGAKGKRTAPSTQWGEGWGEGASTIKFQHYEISNFALPGFESKHNLNYWDNNSYYGFGLSASGYEDGIRYTNEDDLEKYVENPLSRIFVQKLSEKEILEEEIFLGLRKSEGINVEKIDKKFNIDFDKKFEATIKKYISTGHLEKTKLGYKLSLNGILVSNEILAEFIEL